MLNVLEGSFDRTLWQDKATGYHEWADAVCAAGSAVGWAQSGLAAPGKLKNPVIKGEEAGLMILNFDNNATALWDANRYNENN